MGVQSPFDAIAMQTVTLLAMHTNRTGGALHRQTPVKDVTNAIYTTVYKGKLSGERRGK